MNVGRADQVNVGAQRWWHLRFGASQLSGRGRNGEVKAQRCSSSGLFKCSLREYHGHSRTILGGRRHELQPERSCRSSAVERPEQLPRCLELPVPIIHGRLQRRFLPRCLGFPWPAILPGSNPGCHKPFEVMRRGKGRVSSRQYQHRPYGPGAAVTRVAKV